MNKTKIYQNKLNKQSHSESMRYRQELGLCFDQPFEYMYLTGKGNVGNSCISKIKLRILSNVRCENDKDMLFMEPNWGTQHCFTECELNKKLTLKESTNRHLWKIGTYVSVAYNNCVYTLNTINTDIPGVTYILNTSVSLQLG